MFNQKISNNFDLIRLFAATQVAFCHSTEILTKDTYYFDGWFEFLKLFPGVAIFFFISGYLITKSFESNDNLKDYSINRIIRIFPALLVCNFIAMLSVSLSGYFDEKNIGFGQISLWYLAQSTIVQFYNPDFMRAYGVGVLNGSLWTICVELQFYFIVPIIYRSLKKINSNYFLPIILILIGLSVFSNRMLYSLQSEYGDTVYWKLLRVAFLPWLYMFLTGLLFQKYINKSQKNVSNIQFFSLLGVYILYAWFMYHQQWTFNNGISPLIFLPLAMVTYAFAYSFPNLSETVLKKNDISYGIYIYHMPIVNLLIYFGFTGRLIYPLLITMVAIFLAALSWFALEKPIMRFKKHAMK
jgi:peptidoglycan/LPS O-acetylase OafA/YrhL